MGPDMRKPVFGLTKYSEYSFALERLDLPKIIPVKFGEIFYLVDNRRSHLKQLLKDGC